MKMKSLSASKNKSDAPLDPETTEVERQNAQNSPILEEISVLRHLNIALLRSFYAF
jgi:hypothetical protein